MKLSCPYCHSTDIEEIGTIVMMRVTDETRQVHGDEDVVYRPQSPIYECMMCDTEPFASLDMTDRTRESDLC